MFLLWRNPEKKFKTRRNYVTARCFELRKTSRCFLRLFLKWEYLVHVAMWLNHTICKLVFSDKLLKLLFKLIVLFHFDAFISGNWNIKHRSELALVPEELVRIWFPMCMNVSAYSIFYRWYKYYLHDHEVIYLYT